MTTRIHDNQIKAVFITILFSLLILITIIQGPQSKRPEENNEISRTGLFQINPVNNR